MAELLTYEATDAVAVVTMDDGRANVLSLAMQAELADALDRAQADGLAVVLAGRPGRFSGGFDLPALLAGGPDAGAMLLGGFELAHRMLAFPRPIVVACTGHAIAMGAFLLLGGDHRIGVAGADHKITANEVAIGLTLPWAPVALCRGRLTAPAFHQAVDLATVFTPDQAVVAGFLDDVAPSGVLVERAVAKAGALATLDPAAHAATKLRSRGPLLDEVRAGIERDAVELAPLFA